MAAKRKYNWEEWFSRPRTVLMRGMDYHCSQTMMWQQSHNNAKRRNVWIKVIDLNDRIIIEVIGKRDMKDESIHTDTTAVAG